MSNNNQKISKHKRGDLSFYSSKKKELNSSWGNLLKIYATSLKSKDKLFDNLSPEKVEIETKQPDSSASTNK